MRRTVVRREISLWIVLSALSPTLALSAPTTPCTHDSMSAAITAIADTVERTNQRSKLRKLAVDAESRQAASLSRVDAACLNYLIGSAYFVLSRSGPTTRADASQAVHFLTKAQALAPTLMRSRQPTSRLKTSWRRLGKANGWLESTRLVSIKTPPLPAGHTLVLAPPSDFSLCSECMNELVIPPESTVSIRPGRYRVGHRSACGTHFPSGASSLAAGALDAPPQPACPVTLKAVDDGQTIDATTVQTLDGASLPANALTTASGRVRVSAPGYTSQTIDLDGAEPTLTVALKRCSVDLIIEATPPTAVVTGDGLGPWGMRALTLNAPGHQKIERPFNVKRPEACHPVTKQLSQIQLPRAVSVRALDSAGQAVTPSRLVVNGEPVEMLGFYRTPGHYTYAALHPALGHVAGALQVPACITDDCPPVVLDIRFAQAAPAADAWGVPRILTTAGGILLAGGVLAGLNAIQKQEELNEYTTKRLEGAPVSDRIKARDEAAMTADGLFVLGGASLLTAWVWELVEDDE